MGNVQVYQGTKLIYEGDAEDVRDKVADMFEEKFGIPLDLVEYEEDEYRLCLHSEAHDILTDQQAEKLTKMGISTEEVSTTKAFEKHLGIRISLND